MFGPYNEGTGDREPPIKCKTMKCKLFWAGVIGTMLSGIVGGRAQGSTYGPGAKSRSLRPNDFMRRAL